MNGAHALLDLYANLGVEVCFANPGTTELPLVEALESVTGIRPFLGLSEGVIAGAADGYGRMTGLPAISILHLGPGFANSISNLHNARRAKTPMINIVGDHASWHVEADPPMNSDVLGLAHAASDWVGSIQSPRSVLALGMEAFGEAMAGNTATLVFPADIQVAEAVAAPLGLTAVPEPSAVRVTDSVVAALGRPESALFLGAGALHGENLRLAAAIATKTHSRLISETFAARSERGLGVPSTERLPYFPEQAMACLEDLDTLVLVGAPSPVAFFGYEGMASSLVPEWVSVHTLSTEHNPGLALRALAVQVGIDDEAREADASVGPGPVPDGGLNVVSLGAALAATQEPNTILVDESATSGLPYFVSSEAAPAFDHLMLTGGSLGFGLPAAIGAAIACPERPVVAFVADGSAMYTIQALWTMQRYLLNVTVVVASNELYRILRIEGDRTGIEVDTVVDSMTDISGLSWTDLAKGMGVAGSRVTTGLDFAEAMETARSTDGPFLIEVPL